MMKLLFVLFVIPCLVQAQVKNDDWASRSNVPNAVANTVVAALHSFKRNDVAKNSISGNCSYKGGSCNGAQIVLSKDDKTIYNTTLTANTSFIIPNLKKHEDYILTLSWASHQLSEIKKVTTGEFVEIVLSDKK